MRPILFFSLAFFVVTSPVRGALTSQDLDKIRLIVKEEVAVSEERLRKEVAASEARLRTEIAASETRMKEYVDIKFEEVDTKFKGVDTRFEELDKRNLLIVGFVSALIILIVVTVGIPQIIMAWRRQNERAQDRKIEELAQEIETLKQKHIISP